MRWWRRWWWVPVVFGLMGQEAPEGCREDGMGNREFRRDPALPALPFDPVTRALTQDVLYLYPDDNWQVKLQQAYQTTQIVLVGPGEFKMLAAAGGGTAMAFPKRQIRGLNRPTIVSEDSVILQAFVSESASIGTLESVNVRLSGSSLVVAASRWHVRDVWFSDNGVSAGVAVVLSGVSEVVVEGCVDNYSIPGTVFVKVFPGSTNNLVLGNVAPAWADVVEHTVIDGNVVAGNVGSVLAL